MGRALGYLTLCTSGVSEGELEDILSLDDVVLNDTYQFWTPPLRRLPPLLLARIRFALAEYLVERGSDSVRVLMWYHRQFIEAAQDRYCADEALRKEMHGIVAEYYLGVWAGECSNCCFLFSKAEYRFELFFYIRKSLELSQFVDVLCLLPESTIRVIDNGKTVY